MLVVIQLSGGNDGLNTVVPFTHPEYRGMRPKLALGPDQVLRINDELGLHPSMAGFHGLLEDGLLAIVQGTGYPDPNLRPAIVGVFTDLSGPAPPGLSLSATIDTRFTSQPTTLKLVAILLAITSTVIALLACMVLFPITFANGMDPAGGPGLVFKNMPVALMALPGGAIWAVVFFLLLFVAALTSAISLLEVAWGM